MDTARGFDDGRVGDGEGLRADGGGHDVLDAALASPPDDGGDINGGGDIDGAAWTMPPSRSAVTSGACTCAPITTGCRC
jgi:hypothetical protein